jgi:RimJ/RimL family protein N-acetyltransferase
MYRLREISKDDVNIINSWRQQEELINYLGANFRYINKETEYNWFDEYMKNRSNNVRLMICSGENSIGMVSLTNINWINRSSEFHILIGDKKNREQGIGSYVMKSIIHHAFNDLALRRIELRVLEDNDHAIKLYEKLAFKKKD